MAPTSVSYFPLTFISLAAKIPDKITIILRTMYSNHTVDGGSERAYGGLSSHKISAPYMKLGSIDGGFGNSGPAPKLGKILLKFNHENLHHFFQLVPIANVAGGISCPYEGLLLHKKTRQLKMLKDKKKKKKKKKKDFPIFCSIF
mmetsp:Transcript_17232/g.22402  ORF Transcript_17232/g.22402 Transcript_17232/m.22402 type:complete len:145 (+) Transcript_17232:366-800(+)